MEEDHATTHILASIASAGLNDRDSLRTFFEQTLLDKRNHDLETEYQMIEYSHTRYDIHAGESDSVANGSSRPIEKKYENYDDLLHALLHALTDWIGLIEKIKSHSKTQGLPIDSQPQHH